MKDSSIETKKNPQTNWICGFVSLSNNTPTQRQYYDFCDSRYAIA